jgi:hypothetical protein
MRPAALREDDARNLLLVRAIEREDAAGDLLTGEDRMRADAAGRAARGDGRKGSGRKGEDRFLAARARFAAARIATRHPAAGSALAAAQWPAWANWAVPLAAFVLGVTVNEIGNGRRLDLLALPLLGTLVWNLAVYLWILAAPLLAWRRQRASRLPLPARLSALARRRFGTATPVARALGHFAHDWTRAAARLTSARAARTLHWGAAAFAAGVIAGIYLRGLAIEYRAGWESTFLGPGAVHAILSAMLAPASAVTGIAVPDVAAIADLRWREHNGGEAAPWIHLYVALLALVVVAPRSVLAMWHAARATALARAVPVPGREDFYVRRLLRTGCGEAASIRVTPYAVRPEPGQRDRLAALLRAAFGDAARVHFDDPVDYGGEDAWLAGLTVRPDDDDHVMLFSLSATPEDENHGALARGLAARLAGSGTTLAAILDAGAMRARFAGEARLDERLATRARAWEAVLAPAGLVPLVLDLAGSDPADVARIEAVLVAGAGLEGGR